MRKGDKSGPTDKQQRKAAASGKAGERKGAARPETDKGAWAALDRLHGGGKVNGRRKVPFGPVGGSGRKTNLARSS
jgi:hypothetical protein